MKGAQESSLTGRNIMAGIRAAKGHNEWFVTEGHRQGIGKIFHHDYDQAVGL